MSIMPLEQAIRIAEQHNAWRRGETDEPVRDVKMIGMAIDVLIEHARLV